jgi:hypothetical protein
MVYPRNARSLAAWIPVAAGDLVGIVGTHPPLEQSLANAGAKVVAMPHRPADDPGPAVPLAHLIVLDADARDAWLAPGAVAGVVQVGGTVLVSVRHRWTVLRRDGLSARRLERRMAGAGLVNGRVLGASHGLYNLRALTPLDATLMRWYAEQSFLPRSYRGAIGVSLLCRVGKGAPLRALFPVLVGIGTLGTPT